MAKYIQDGKSIIGDAAIGLIAHSNDGESWGFYVKNKIKDISANGTVIRLWFDDKTIGDIDLREVTNQPSWTPDKPGVILAITDIANWLNGNTDLQIQTLIGSGNDISWTSKNLLEGIKNYISNTIDISNDTFNLLNEMAMDIAQTRQHVIDSSTYLFDMRQILIDLQPYIHDLKKFQNGTNGFQIIQPANGMVNGNWYLIRVLDPSVFSTLMDSGGDLGLSAVTFPSGTPLTTAYINSTGFNKIQLSVGKVIAYKL